MKVISIRRMGAFLLLLLVLLVPVTVFAAGGVNPEEARNAVFRVVVKDEGSGAVASFGSGFGVGESAPISYVLTNEHVIADNPDSVCIWVGNNTEIPCTVVAEDATKDLAILKLSTPIDEEPLPIGRQDDVKIGDNVFALGYPTNDISTTITSFADDVSVSKGIVSKYSTWNGVLYYQIDAALNQGNSGGPLLHESGVVIGICAMKMNDTQGINGAIRMEEALDLLSSVGISCKTVELTTAESSIPIATPTASATPAPTATATPMATVIPTEKSGRSLWSVLWLIIFILTSIAFACVLSYILWQRKKNGAKLIDLVRPTRRQEDMGYIIGLRGTYQGAVIALEGETVFFGRDPQKCQIVFSARENTIARVHCALRYDGNRDRFLLESYSDNGTFVVNGAKLCDGGNAELTDGNRFYLVEESCLFEVRLHAPKENRKGEF